MRRHLSEKPCQGKRPRNAPGLGQRFVLTATAISAALLMPSWALAETITLAPSADGTLYESASNAESSGIGPTLFVGRIFQSGGLLRRGLVQFDVANSLPAGAVIQEVRLGMRLSRKAPDLGETTLALHRVLEPWGEGTSNAGGLGGLGTDATPGDVTWTKSAFPGADWSQAGGSFVADASGTLNINDLGEIVWESSAGLVADVQLWIDQPELDHGWAILGDETQLGTAVRLDSRENAVASVRPYLEINYTVPEPTMFALLSIGAAGLTLLVKRSRNVAFGMAVVLTCLEASSALAQPDFLPSIQQSPYTVRFETVATGLNEVSGGTEQYAPTDMVFPSDGSGRMFVTTLGGVIRVGTPGGGLLTTPYLNTVNAQSDILVDGYGMIAMTFHPGFADPSSNGFKKFYTLETEKRNAGPSDMPLSVTNRVTHQTVLYEYTADDPAANVFSGSKRQVFRLGVPGTHDTNELVFGPDDYLYIGSGDGCNVGNSSEIVCSDNAQDLSNTFGKILRINPLDPVDDPGSEDLSSPNGNYQIPADNPFIDTPEARGEIYAYGVRNPYRMSFDRETGRLYMGDVGQRNIESIDEVIAGGNYGWNDMEGKFLYDKTNQDGLVPDADLDGNGVGDHAEANGYQEPLLQYDHQDGKSVTAGFVYRGDAFPELNGKFIFGDFRGPLNLFEGRLLIGDLEAGLVQELNVAASGVQLPDLIYSFAEDADGEIYLLGGENDGTTGVILKLVRENPFGDTNADGKVDLEDLNNVRNNFGGTGLGDANFDGKVDLDDLNAVRNNFGAGNSASAVPEPASLGLLATAALLGVAWRTRRPRV